MDALRGVLVLLVILGHLAEIVGWHGVMLWIGSGFRMALMIGLSGYLLNLPRIRAQPVMELAAHYGRRLILPWLCASLLYLIMAGRVPDWSLPLDILLRPAFHLWYVPVLCFLVLIARLSPLPPHGTVALALPVSLATMYVFGVHQGNFGQGLLAFDSRFLRYPFYFFLGVMLARRPAVLRDSWLTALLAAIGIAWWAGRYHGDAPLAELAARLVMNVGLVALLPIVAAVPIYVPMLVALGRASLFYYLWHPMAIGLALAMGLPPAFAFVAVVVVLMLVCRGLGSLPMLALLSGAVVRRVRTGVTAPRDGALAAT